MKLYYQALKENFKTYFGCDAENIKPLAPTASNRQYFRMVAGEHRCIGAYNPDKSENEAFIYIANQLQKNGVHVPKVFRADMEQKLYLQEDLGDRTLYDLVSELRNNSSSEYLSWYKKVIDQMPALQVKAANGFDFSKCFPRSTFDEQSIRWDLNYFKYYFLKLANIPFHEQKLEDDFNQLTQFLLQAPSNNFLFRDFQSRNIMIHNDDIYFIDFQGGRKGALQYDLASLLFEAKAGLTPDERNELLQYYLEVFSGIDSFNKETFLKYFPAFALIRILQAFGAYGYRGYFERKSFFLQSIPPALNNLKWVLQNMDLGIELPHLTQALQNMTEMNTFQTNQVDSSGKLQVTINSFSYKKGIPQDYSGNGGGFVFDCRALLNPGRLDAYRDKNGKDQEVIDFLDPLEEVKSFLDNAKSIVSASIETYIAKGFEHLMINFGCTGGQHRSVYSAEHMAEYLAKSYPVTVRLHHIEQDKNNGETIV